MTPSAATVAPLSEAAAPAECSASPAGGRSETPAYNRLAATQRRLHHLGHVQSMVGWDQAANMPAGGNEARAAAMAEVAALMHDTLTAPDTGAALEAAAAEPLSPLEQANRREIGRHWRAATAVPSDLVQRKELAASRCEHAWRSQRPANDWAGFARNLEPVLAIAREEAEALSQAKGLAPYDALLDQFEPGMRAETVARLFDDLRSWLPGLIRQVQQRQEAEEAERPLLQPQGPFPVEAQRALGERAMRALGFDFNGGRLDVSTHPFCGGVPEDVRLTTRYREGDLLSGLMGTVHETGHARYEQGLPRAWLGQPVARARSMALHESQSLSFEMQLGSHPGFVARVAPWLEELFGPQPAFAPDNLLRLMTRVRPSDIRVEADEVTYPAHVMLRFELERALIEGRMEVADLPVAWDAQMQQLLGRRTLGAEHLGPMQDVHWAAGLFGYFPCYTLGALYAAQWFAAMRRERPTLDADLMAGDWSPVFDWLNRHIWQAASRYPTDELVLRASGEPLNPAHFRRHLESRYLD